MIVKIKIMIIIPFLVKKLIKKILMIINVIKKINVNHHQYQDQHKMINNLLMIL